MCVTTHVIGKDAYSGPMNVRASNLRKTNHVVSTEVGYTDDDIMYINVAFLEPSDAARRVLLGHC
jgi:hypothetical protein